MNRLEFAVPDISIVLAEYDQIQVFRADAEAGTYVEITTVATRLNLIPEQTVYFYDDMSGLSSHWYQNRYYNSTTGDYSNFSTAVQGGTQPEKVGYTFKNYAPAPGEWGKALTADDARYTYMWGVDVVAADLNQSEWTDEQFDFFVDQAVAAFERFLTCDIRKRVYKTFPADSLVQSRQWRSGVDYTDEEDPYDFDPFLFRQNGMIMLRHFPVISIERAVMYSPVHSQIVDLLASDWIRLDKQTGIVHIMPKGTSVAPIGGLGYQSPLMYYAGLGGGYPGGFEFDYTTGYKSSDFVPEDLRDVIGKFMGIQLLDTIGDGLMAGFSSMSVSLDGLSESFSSTQSATSGYFGPRQQSWAKQIKEWLIANRYKYGRVPFGFTGV